ncbi:MAG: hypothetical protein LBP62_03240 [Clostridiales bacterium]|jgi:chromosome segregation ATPase|nr:hypothetical protein [Clostridiales bacterium]
MLDFLRRNKITIIIITLTAVFFGLLGVLGGAVYEELRGISYEPADLEAAYERGRAESAEYRAYLDALIADLQAEINTAGDTSALDEINAIYGPALDNIDDKLADADADVADLRGKKLATLTSLKNSLDGLLTAYDTKKTELAGELAIVNAAIAELDEAGEGDSTEAAGYEVAREYILSQIADTETVIASVQSQIAAIDAEIAELQNN